MPASINRFVSKSERMNKIQAEKLRSAVQTIQSEMDLPLSVVSDIYKHIEKKTASEGKWPFVMISPDQNALVIDYITENSKRPIVSVKLWALCFKYLISETGQISLRRDEIAKKLHQLPRTISELMTELETCGAIIRRRERRNGMKGPGIVHYFVNPNVATHLAGAERDAAQRATPPLLLVMQGGKADVGPPATPPI